MKLVSAVFNFLFKLFEAVFNLLFGRKSSSGRIIIFKNCGVSIKLNDSNADVKSKDVLGEGAFSTVFVGEDASPKFGHPIKKYAIKRMFLQNEEFIHAYEEEVASFQRFRHPNVMTILDAQDSYEEGNKCRVAYLLFPLMRGSLRDQLNDTVLTSGWYDVSSDVRQQRLRSTLRQYLDILRAFNTLHTHDPPFIHQDIKPENILISTQNNYGGQYDNNSSSRDGYSVDVEMGSLMHDTSAHGGKSLIDNVSIWSNGKPLLTDFGSVRKAVV